MRDQEHKFIEYIKDNHVLSTIAIERAVFAVEKNQEPLGEMLTKLGLLSEEKLVSIYAAYCGITIANDDDFPEEKLKVLDIEEQFFSGANVIVLSESKEIIKLATNDPLDEFTKKAVNYLTGKKVEYLVSTTSDVMGYYENQN